MPTKLPTPSTHLIRLFAAPNHRLPCLRCQLRHLTTTTTSRYPNPPLTKELTHSRRRDGELQPKPLSRPLGLPHPPHPGENTGRDPRTLAQRRDDFASYTQHKARRQKLLTDVFEKHYYRDLGNLGKVWKGKSILAPATPFKAGMALYFPNLEGMTLEGRGIGWGKTWGQTTPVLRGRVSVVGMVHTSWAEDQVKSFVGAGENPELYKLVTAEAEEGGAQFVTVNVEENPLKALMVRLFFGRLRRAREQGEWGRYFLNRRGLSDEIRDALAMWNSKVGYVYLVDKECRIRWAGNGYAQPQEKESLVRCVRRLVAEAKGVKRGPVLRREEPRQTGKAVEEVGVETAREAVAA